MFICLKSSNIEGILDRSNTNNNNNNNILV